MSQKQTVAINGRLYDAHTGLPVTAAHATRQALRKPARATTAAAPVAAQNTVRTTTTQAQKIHRKVQKSQTLNRKFITKPTSQAAPQPHTAAISVRNTKRADIKSAAPKKASLAQSTRAKQHITPLYTLDQAPSAKKHTETLQSADIAATTHPVVTRAHTIQSAKKQKAAQHLPSAQEIKKSAIAQALENAPAHHAKQHSKGISFKQRLAGAMFGCAALVLFAGYLTYLNVPNISVRVAAAQAGIDASYPGYHPDGYRLNGPIAFSDGKVQIKFAATAGESNFALNQSRSTWDSSALLENYVREKSNDDYTVSQEKGLTIYTYGGNAAWVSGGILYTIDGDATLSPDQIHKIATSTS